MVRFLGFDDLIDRMVASGPERGALVLFDGAQGVRGVSWRELGALVEARAGELRNRGCLCEAVLADGSLGCVVEVFSAVRAGVQVALVDPMIPNDVLGPLLEAVDADGVWANDSARQEALQAKLAPLRSPEFGARGVLFFTSGTTSASKAVVLTDESLMASAYNGSSLMPLSEDDTLLCLLPLSHVFGFVCGLLWGLACGATVALGRGPRYYADDLTLFKPTTVSVVPKLLQYLVARGALVEELKLVLVGAADCGDDLLNAVRARGIRASLGYGLTETSSGIALSTGDDFHAMSICPDDEVTIAEDGEILVKAPTCVMQGYYRDAEKIASALVDGVLHTGDKGFVDDDGLLHVQGRLKDVLTLPGGTKVFLPDYEAAVSAALGEPDVCVCLNDGALALVCGTLVHARDDSAIMKAIEPAMASYPPASRIVRIVRLDHALPRTPAGDIERWKVNVTK